MTHLLKWQFQPERRTQSWKGTIKRERGRIADRERESSRLHFDMMQIEKLFRISRRVAARQTRMPLHTFPPTCPYSIDFLRDPDALPD